MIRRHLNVAIRKKMQLIPLNPATHKLYVANQNSKDVSVITPPPVAPAPPTPTPTTTPTPTMTITLRRLSWGSNTQPVTRGS